MPLQPSGSFQYDHVAAFSNMDALAARPGMLHSVSISKKATTSGVLTLYDSLTHGTGNVIAIIDTIQGVATLLYDVWFQVGLSYSYAGTTAGDVTLAWN